MNASEDTIRQMIRHENELMNHRITWLTTTEGLLFTALGFAWGRNDATSLVYVLCFIGILVPLSTAWLLHGAQKAVERLKNHWDRQCPEDYGGPGVVGYWNRARLAHLSTPWITFPILFMLGWAFIGVINFQRSQKPAPEGTPSAKAVSQP